MRRRVVGADRHPRLIRVRADSDLARVVWEEGRLTLARRSLWRPKLSVKFEVAARIVGEPDPHKGEVLEAEEGLIERIALRWRHWRRIEVVYLELEPSAPSR